MNTEDHRFDSFMISIGRIAMVWAVIEFYISQALWELQNVEAGAGACVTAQLIGPGPRIRALISLLDYRSSSPRNDTENKLISDFNRLSERIEGLGRQRNFYLHTQAVIENETGVIHHGHVTADKRLEFAYKAVDFARMNKLKDDILTAGTDFNVLFERALAELPAWPRTQYEQSPVGFRSLRKKPDSAP